MSLQDLKVKPFPPVFQGQLTLGNSFHRLRTEQISSLIAEHICLGALAKSMLIPTLQVSTINPVLLRVWPLGKPAQSFHEAEQQEWASSPAGTFFKDGHFFSHPSSWLQSYGNGHSWRRVQQDHWPIPVALLHGIIALGVLV